MNSDHQPATMGRKSKRKRKENSPPHQNQKASSRSCIPIANANDEEESGTSISSLLSGTERDIYSSLQDQNQTFVLALHPPTHWFRSIPTFPTADQDKHGASTFAQSPSETELDGKDAHCTAETMRTLSNHLNRLKSNLHPYCEAIAQLKVSKRRRAPSDDTDTLTRGSASGSQQTYTYSAKYEFRRASRSSQVNPFESLCHLVQFNHRPLISRSALKLCNIDALTGFQIMGGGACKENGGGLDQIVHAPGRLDEKEPVAVPFFVDLCGAPGGFSQYLLFRHENARGFGMSLTGTTDDSVGLDWKVQELECSDLERVDSKADDGRKPRFKIHIGKDGRGDIENWDNVLSLQRAIEADAADALGIANGGGSRDNSSSSNPNRTKQNLNGKASLVVADGGIDAQRNCSDQEGIAHKLICCQVSAALLLLQEQGTFIIKMFGFQTERTRLMMKFLLTVFERIQVLKPIASRPASAERYLFFSGFQGLKENFDLLQWRNDVIEGTCTDRVMNNAGGLDIAGFEKFLDEVDHDMLSLNVRACTKIIDCLREEETKILNGKLRSNNSFCGSEFDLNADFIKKEWRIP